MTEQRARRHVGRRRLVGRRRAARGGRPRRGRRHPEAVGRRRPTPAAARWPTSTTPVPWPDDSASSTTSSTSVTTSTSTSSRPTSPTTPPAAPPTRASSATATSSSIACSGEPTPSGSTRSPPGHHARIVERPDGSRRSRAGRRRREGPVLRRARPLARGARPGAVPGRSPHQGRRAGRGGPARAADGRQARQPGRVLHHRHRRALDVPRRSHRDPPRARRRPRRHASSARSTPSSSSPSASATGLGLAGGTDAALRGRRRRPDGHGHRRPAAPTCSSTGCADRADLGGSAPSPVRWRRRSAPHGTPRPCRVEGDAVVFDAPARRVAPGQSVVLYDGDVVVGGGIAPYDDQRDQPTGSRRAAASPAGRPAGWG